MNADEIYPSTWLKADDLGEDKPSVTIKDAKVEEIGEGSNAKKKVVIYFDEIEKGLVLNKTNYNKIKAEWGSETSGWMSMKVQLYTMLTTFKDKEVPAIRLKPLGKSPLG